MIIVYPACSLPSSSTSSTSTTFTYCRHVLTILIFIFKVNFKFFSCWTICLKRMEANCIGPHSDQRAFSLNCLLMMALLFMPWEEALKEFVWDICPDFTIITYRMNFLFPSTTTIPYYRSFVLNWWMDYTNMTDFFVCYLLSEVM